MKIVLLLSLFAGLGWAQYNGGGVFPPGGGTGSGASSTSQLTDLKWVRTSATQATLTVPTGGTVVMCGNVNTTIAAGSFTITGAGSWAAASSTFYTYFDCLSQTIKVDTTASITQANVTLAGGLVFGSAVAVAYPSNNIAQIARLTAGNSAVNQFDTSPITRDIAAYTANTIPVAGANCTVTPGANGTGPTITCSGASTQIVFVGGKTVNCDAGIAVVGAPWSGGAAISGSNSFCNTGFGGIHKFLPSGTDDFYLEFTYPTGVTNIDLNLAYIMDLTPSGNVKFNARLGCSTAGGTFGAPSFNAFSSVTTSVSITGITEVTITNLNRTGCNALDPAVIHLLRDNTVGSNNPSSAYLGRGAAAITRPLP